MPEVTSTEIERVFREQYGRAVAVLVRLSGDIDVAEEAVQDQSKKLNFVAKLAAKIEVTKAYRDIEMFEEMCNE